MRPCNVDGIRLEFYSSNLTQVSQTRETMAMEAGVEADPINPMRLFSELSPRLPDDAIVTADSGSSANWYAPEVADGQRRRHGRRPRRQGRGSAFLPCEGRR